MPRKSRIPSYRLHKATGQAVVVLGGRSLYLGTFGSAASRAAYDRVIAEWLANRRQADAPVSLAAAAAPARPPAAGVTEMTVTELCVAYWQHVTTYYVKKGEPTSEQDTIRQALRFVRRLYGPTRAIDFGPLALQAVREAMVRHPITRAVRVRDRQTGAVRVEEKVYRTGLARGFVNKQVGRIRGLFKWAVSRQLLPAHVHQALTTVADLRKDHTTAREKPPVRPVPPEHLGPVLAKVPAVIRAMIELQLLCGGRPQDVVEMRAGDIDARGPLWEYRPGRHKTEHHEADRLLYLGPRAQAVLRPYLEGLRPDEHVFSPRRAEAARLAALRKGKGKGGAPASPDRRPLRDAYDADSYRRGVRRACVALHIPVWFPLQLRHTAATRIRQEFGLEASQAVLGHAELTVTQVYAEKHQTLARDVMARIG